jgi:hypothetical protein
MTSSSPDFWILMAPAFGALICSVASWITSLANGRKATRSVQAAEKAVNLGEENRERLHEVSKQFDGRLSQLLERAEAAQRALGITEGRDQERGIHRGESALAAEHARELVALAAERALEILRLATEKALTQGAAAAPRDLVEKAAAMLTPAADSAAPADFVAVRVAPGVEVRKIDESA